MKVTIDNFNNQLEVTVQGDTMTVALERGHFVLSDAVNTECSFETEEDYARLLHDAALSLVTLGTDVTSFDEWENLFSSWADDEPGDDVDPEDLEAYHKCLSNDRADFEREQDAARNWQSLTDLDAKAIWDYLENRWQI